MPLCRSKLCDVAALKNVVEVSSVTKTLSQVPKCGLFFSVSSNVKSMSGFFFSIGFFAQRKVNCASCVVGVEMG